MQTLEKISLFHNLLDDLPRELWELPKLRVVTLRSNGVAVNTDRAVFAPQSAETLSTTSRLARSMTVLGRVSKCQIGV
jgi:hypothetical protein